MVVGLLCTLLMADAAMVGDAPGLAALNIEAERGVDESLVKMLSDAVCLGSKSMFNTGWSVRSLYELG